MGDSPIVPGGILPSPARVIKAALVLFTENNLTKNILWSIGLNTAGYVEAILISLVFGFLIGLYPFFRGLFNRPIDAFRFVPLTGVIGLFILWFGLGSSMKIHFLAFGIWIYMLPVIVRRIDDVEDVYIKTAYTLGATNFQTIRTIYWPHVMSNFSNDIRVLTAISWTYIIIIEGIGSEGGIGSLMWKTGIRQGNIDKLFAMLFIIVIIGFIQDKFFIWLDKRMFPFKYQDQESKKSSLLLNNALWLRIKKILSIGLTLLIALIMIMFLINEYTGILGKANYLHEAFGDTFVLMAILMILLSVWLVKDFIFISHKKHATAK